MIRTITIVCANGHALASAWYDDARCSAAHAMELFAKAHAYAESERPRCRDCESSTFNYQDKPTPHATIEAAIVAGPVPPSLFLLATAGRGDAAA